jgi:hypothetical protein
MVWAILPVFVFASQTVCGFRISPSIYQFKERPQNPLVPVIFKDRQRRAKIKCRSAAMESNLKTPSGVIEP